MKNSGDDIISAMNFKPDIRKAEYPAGSHGLLSFPTANIL